MPTTSENKRLAAREIIDILHEIATLLVGPIELSWSIPQLWH